MTTATAVVKNKPCNFGQIAGGLLVLQGPWRNAQIWQGSKPEDKALTLKNTSPVGEESMYCMFDVASPAAALKHERNRGNFGFLHVSSDRIWKDEGSVRTLILERTGKRVDEYKRIGVGLMGSKKVTNATARWGKKTVWKSCKLGYG